MLVWKLKHFILSIILLGGMLSCRQEVVHKILVVHSYESDYPAYTDANRMIREKFEHEDMNAEIKTFYLDCEQYRADAEEDRISIYLDSISSWKPDIILVYKDQATYSLLHCKHPLAGSIPVVFAGVKYPNDPLLKQYSNVTGFRDKPDYLTNIRLMEKLLGTMTVFMLQDKTYMDNRVKEELRTQLEPAGIPIANNRPMYLSLEEHDYLSTQKYRERPDSLLVNIVSMQNDGLASVNWYMSKFAPYQYYLKSKQDYRVSNVSRFASKPSFTTINEELGYDSKLVGGYLTSLETEINESVQRAIDILKGKPVSHFPTITESAKGFVFDYPQVEFWKIDPQKLPKNATYLNRSFRQHYPIIFWFLIISTGAGILITTTLFIALYIREAKAKRRAQKELLRERDSLAIALKKAEESDRMKSIFLANMSHEIRTPLNAIVGFTELITDKNNTEEDKEQFIEIIKTNVDLFLKVVTDVLDLVRYESGQTPFVYEKCNLTELLHCLYNRYHEEMPVGVKLKLEIPSSPCMIETDCSRLAQVIENLIKNAIKFTEKGFIEIGYEDLPHIQTVHIRVKDSGSGIPEDKQEKIFERFTKLDEFTQGTGLGLAICQVIIDRFNGQIQLQSEVDKGSCFTIILPYKH